MTKQELNRDVKRLKKSIDRANVKDGNDERFAFIEKEVKPEFKRLYRADDTLQSFSADSLRIMLRLNVRFNIVPFHQFGLFIPD
ncbi:MAG TPA: hypothetical protein VFM99_07665 [Chitinophagales bacterium]|nr:hypothetical protein [Chitinophagales bacterium]